MQFMMLRGRCLQNMRTQQNTVFGECGLQADTMPRCVAACAWERMGAALARVRPHAILAMLRARLPETRASQVAQRVGPDRVA